MTLPGVEIPALSGLVAAIKLILEGGSVPKARRRQWFVDNIEPSYKLLEEINEEYLRKFGEAAQLLKARGDVEKTIALLREDRPRKRFERTGALSQVRSLVKASVKKKPFPRSRKAPSETRQLFEMYVFAYERYMNSASPLDPDGKSQTWYSYFIETFAKAVEQGEDPYAKDYSGAAQGKRLVQEAINTLERAVQDGIPDAFADVQNRYNELRAHCLDAGIR